MMETEATPKQWRESCFMHSDAEDVADRAVNEAIGYRPASRTFFLRMVIGKIADEIQRMEGTDTK